MLKINWLAVANEKIAGNSQRNTENVETRKRNYNFAWKVICNYVKYFKHIEFLSSFLLRKAELMGFVLLFKSKIL